MSRKKSCVIIAGPKFIANSTNIIFLPEKASAVSAKGEGFEVVEDELVVLDLHHLSLTHGVASLWPSRPHRVHRHDLRRLRGRNFSARTVLFLSLACSLRLYPPAPVSGYIQEKFMQEGRCFLSLRKGRSISDRMLIAQGNFIRCGAGNSRETGARKKQT